jgi:hypothetical protein
MTLKIEIAFLPENPPPDGLANLIHFCISGDKPLPISIGNTNLRLRIERAATGGREVDGALSLMIEGVTL